MDGTNEPPKGDQVPSSENRLRSIGDSQRFSDHLTTADRIVMTSDEDDLTSNEDIKMEQDRVGKWIARICWLALGGTLCNFLAILCVLGWKWVMNK